MIRHPQPEPSYRALVALFINSAGACRRAAMESARTGRPVGFYGPELHKDTARDYLREARERRCDSRFGWLPE